jgi:hypothetical protein
VARRDLQKTIVLMPARNVRANSRAANASALSRGSSHSTWREPCGAPLFDTVVNGNPKSAVASWFGLPIVAEAQRTCGAAP